MKNDSCLFKVKSEFSIITAVCYNIQDVCIFKDTLLDNPKIKQATHNILAYITPEEKRFDDDETHAGIQVLQMMQLSWCKNCPVIVSRWFGGILLHDRFRFIILMALNVLKERGFALQKDKKNKDANKKDEKQKGKSKMIILLQYFNVDLDLFPFIHILCF